MAAGTPLILGRTPAARAPRPLTHAPRVHVRDSALLVRGATRPTLDPTRRTRAPRLARRPVTPTASTGAKRRRTTSCGRRGILAAGRAMSWITWCRSPAAVPTRPATCSGRRWARRRRRTRWSGRGAPRHGAIDRPPRGRPLIESEVSQGRRSLSECSMSHPYSTLPPPMTDPRLRQSYLVEPSVQDALYQAADVLGMPTCPDLVTQEMDATRCFGHRM